MKLRNCALITSIFIFFAVVESAFAKYSGGSGEPNDPYKIATAQDLINLGNEPNDYDKHFVMTGKIDMDPNVTGIPAFTTAVVAPEGEPEFTGVFDGNNLTISNLTINGSYQQNYLGLFGKINLAIIKNLGLENVFVSGLDSSYVGGLVGYSDRSWNDRGSISNCYSTGSVVGNDYVGGLTGYNNRNEISNCYSTSSVDGNDYVGGLVGYNTNVVSNCYTTGSVYGNDYVGGLVGSIISLGFITNCYSNSQVNGNHVVGGLVGENIGDYKNYCIISNCYSTGIVTGNEDVGGLVGYSSYDNVMNCFWDYETSGRLESAGGYGLPTDLMKIKAVFTFFDWDFEGNFRTKPVWVIRDGISYPHLNMLEGQGTLNEPYLISSPAQFITIGHQNYYWDKYFKLLNDIDLNGSQLQVIGNHNVPFNGTFDGGDHIISNFNIISDQNYVGLFGYVESGLIHDLGLEDFYIDANNEYLVGSIAGALDHSTISNCHATGSVNGNDYVGGLTGSNYYSSITSSFSAVMVTGNNSIGGLAGQNHLASISKCYSNGSVNGNVYVGGLVGRNFSDAEISSCYSTGSVAGNDHVGGLAGSYNPSNVRNCFWDIETSGQSESAGGTGKTTAQMQDINTFLNAGWDFIGETDNGTEDIWWIDNGMDYPRLWWELEPED